MLLKIEFYGRGMAISAKVDCAPCYKKNCDRDDCLKDVSVEKVYNGIESMLRRNSKLQKAG